MTREIVGFPCVELPCVEPGVVIFGRPPLVEVEEVKVTPDGVEVFRYVFKPERIAVLRKDGPPCP